MPLRIVRSATNARLWSACLEDWLSSPAGSGSAAHPCRLWLAHRRQRDAALEAAAEAGIAGWFDPPLHLWSDLSRLFDLRTRPIGVLAGRLLVARLAAARAPTAGMPPRAGGHGPAGTHVLDGLFGELLAEGVGPDELTVRLAEQTVDAFARRRDEWIVSTYRAYRNALDSRGLIDGREIHSLVAERIESGGLEAALRGAGRLHIYGPTSLGGRRRLFRALAAQTGVEVSVHLLLESEPSEWEALTEDVRTLDGPEADPPLVLAMPDALREAAEVARRVKLLIVEQGCRPPDIAVVARSGREDTQRVHRALAEAGVPSTARLRTSLAEIPALRALLELLGAATTGWDDRCLEAVARSPYFGFGVDVGPPDELASRRHAERPEAEWIDVTRSFTSGDALGFRRRLCRVVGGRHDVVRLDQRGVRLLDALLAEWAGLVDEADPPLAAAEWERRLRRLLESNELALSTPFEQGVQVLEAHEAALTPFEHVFVVHANDGEFPRAARRSGALSDDELAALAAAGLPVEDRQAALRRERALWRAVTANPATTVSWRRATPGGVPLLPSLMVPVDVAQVPPPEPVVVTRSGQLRSEVLRLSRLRRGDDRSELGVTDVHAVRRAVLAAFVEELRAGGLDGAGGIEATLGLTAPALLGRDRPVSERPHAWSGRLRDPVVLSAIGRRFGSDHVWSASRLEQYARRPFDFFVHSVLRIARHEEVGEETTPLAVGRVSHAVLEALHRRLLEAGEESFAAGAALLPESCEQVFAALERDADVWLGLPAVWRLRRAQVRRTLEAFVAWDFDRLGKRRLRPIAAEVRFGYDGIEPVRLTGRDTAGRPAELLLAGRIDRVDRLPDATGGVRIVDYKWKNLPSKAGFEDGAVLQPGLYMRAWEILHGEPAREGVFLSLSSPGMGSRSGLSADRVEGMLRLALAIPARVRAGLFEPVQAASCQPVVDSQPGLEVTRTSISVAAGSRFDSPEYETPSGGAPRG